MKADIASIGRKALTVWVTQVARLSWLVLLLAFALSALTVQYTVSHIGINTSTSDMLSPELEFRKNAAARKEAFPEYGGGVSVVVEGPSEEATGLAAERLAAAMAADDAHFRSVFYPQSDPYFLTNGLLYLDSDELYALSNRLAATQGLLGALAEDSSLRGLADVLAAAIESGDVEDEAQRDTFARALDKIARSIESVEAGEPAPLSWRNLMSGEETVSKEDTREFITAKPRADFGSLAPYAPAIAAVRDHARDLGLGPDAGIRVRITGEPAMVQDELQSLQSQMGLVGALSLGMVVILLTLGLRSWQLLVGTVLSLIMGLIWTAGFAAVAIGELNLISVAFAILFIGLSVDFGIHYALRYREAVAAGSPSRQALAEAAEGVGGALFLSAVAAAIGFLSFLPTDYRGVSELGLISGVGMFIALFANLTVLPAVLAVLPVSAAARTAAGSLGARAQDLIRRRHRPILAGALLVAVAAGASLPYAWFDDDPLNLRDPKTESVATLLDLLDDPRVQPYDVEYLAADLEEADALAERLRALPEVDSARTVTNYVPKNQDEKLAVIEEMSFFLGPLFAGEGPGEPLDPAERLAAVERLEAAMAAAPEALRPQAERVAAALAALPRDVATLARLEQALIGTLPRELDRLRQSLGADAVGLDELPPELRDNRLAADGRAIVQVIPREDLRDKPARQRFVAAVRAVVPGITGAPVTIIEAGEAVRSAFEEAAGYAIVLITLLLLMVLRSLVDTLMVLAPLVLAALITVAATVVLEQPFNFANVIVLPLLFGLGVAAGIHIVLRSRREAGREILGTSTPRAVLFSALTTVASFGTLAISAHRGTASMGLLLTIAIVLTMICTLVVLPALLELTARRRKGA